MIADLLVGLTVVHTASEFCPCFLHLRNVKGHVWNHKRAYRMAVSEDVADISAVLAVEPGW